MKFINTYSHLGDTFYHKNNPTPVDNPALFLWNETLAEQLQIPSELSHDKHALAQYFSGNQLLPGSEPISMAYSGHQFGHFSPQLGDGRAHLLGDVLDKSGNRWDIQLKGSGRSAFSRNGDGRCAFGPAIREFIMSEAMCALGIPTTRSLAVVTTGEQVHRETSLPGAIVTRVASSHLRVGTFQYFSAQANTQAIKTLCDFAIQRHYPGCLVDKVDPYVMLLDSIIEKQIELIVQWLRIGFIHGVMNTDNMAISGETIDYGPCAMMGTYNPQTVYSSIDKQGRYAFMQQPVIAQWNIARLAECILPLIDSDNNKAIGKLQPLIEEFPNRFNLAYTKMMAKKIGITNVEAEDQTLINSLLDTLKTQELDYTISFNALTQSLDSVDSPNIQAEKKQPDALNQWIDNWHQRLNKQAISHQQAQQLMTQQNPVVIPRNHHVEAVIQQCQQTNNPVAAEKFIRVLKSPYQLLADTSEYQDQARDRDQCYQTFCGT